MTLKGAADRFGLRQYTEGADINTFNGQIGPATVEDIQARFVAPNIGMVAAAEKRDVAAFLIYNDNTKVGKVLSQQP